MPKSTEMKDRVENGIPDNLEDARGKKDGVKEVEDLRESDGIKERILRTAVNVRIKGCERLGDTFCRSQALAMVLLRRTTALTPSLVFFSKLDHLGNSILSQLFLTRASV